MTNYIKKKFKLCNDNKYYQYPLITNNFKSLYLFQIFVDCGEISSVIKMT